MPLLRQRVFDAHGAFRDDRALHDPFLLELLEAFGKHPVGDVGDGVAQRRETAARSQQHEDDRACPPSPDQLARLMEPGAERGGLREGFLHRSMSSAYRAVGCFARRSHRARLSSGPSRLRATLTPERPAGTRRPGGRHHPHQVTSLLILTILYIVTLLSCGLFRVALRDWSCPMDIGLLLIRLVVG